MARRFLAPETWHSSSPAALILEQSFLPKWEAKTAIRCTQRGAFAKTVPPLRFNKAVSACCKAINRGSWMAFGRSFRSKAAQIERWAWRGCYEGAFPCSSHLHVYVCGFEPPRHPSKNPNLERKDKQLDQRSMFVDLSLLERMMWQTTFGLYPAETVLASMQVLLKVNMKSQYTH